jgi:hypothetical protein
MTPEKIEAVKKLLQSGMAPLNVARQVGISETT